MRPFHAGTVTVNDTLDLLAEHMGVGEEVAELTKKVRCQQIWIKQQERDLLPLSSCVFGVSGYGWFPQLGGSIGGKAEDHQLQAIVGPLWVSSDLLWIQ